MTSSLKFIDIVGDVGYSWAVEGKCNDHHVIFVTILPLSHNPLNSYVNTRLSKSPSFLVRKMHR